MNIYVLKAFLMIIITLLFIFLSDVFLMCLLYLLNFGINNFAHAVILVFFTLSFLLLYSKYIYKIFQKINEKLYKKGIENLSQKHFEKLFNILKWNYFFSKMEFFLTLRWRKKENIYDYFKSSIYDIKITLFFISVCCVFVYYLIPYFFKIDFMKLFQDFYIFFNVENIGLANVLKDFIVIFSFVCFVFYIIKINDVKKIVSNVKNNVLKDLVKKVYVLVISYNKNLSNLSNNIEYIINNKEGIIEAIVNIITKSHTENINSQIIISDFEEAINEFELHIENYKFQKDVSEIFSKLFDTEFNYFCDDFFSRRIEYKLFYDEKIGYIFQETNLLKKIIKSLNDKFENFNFETYDLNGEKNCYETIKTDIEKIFLKELYYCLYDIYKINSFVKSFDRSIKNNFLEKIAELIVKK